MKSLEELVKISREIVAKKGWFIHGEENHLGLIDDITDALTRIQDEAVQDFIKAVNKMNKAKNEK